MYIKKILIFNNANNRYATQGKQLCGMVKLINNGRSGINGSLVITNADKNYNGEWWLLLALDEKKFAYKVNVIDRYEFVVNTALLGNIGCVLVAKDSMCHIVACADVGTQKLSDYLSNNASTIISNANSQGNVTITDDYSQQQSTQYEKFVAATDNYYGNVDTAPKVDVDHLKQMVKQRYKTVDEYSDAFERYYATGRGDNYYDTVKREIAKLLVEFPPYYPLMDKFENSFFVRIEFPDTNRYFVMGVLQEEGVVKYICYGLPGERDNFCDKDFVYVDGNPEGFWMLYQDAVTGQITVWRDKKHS